MDNTLIGGIVATAALGGGFWALGKFGPGAVRSKLHEGYEAIKNSDWVRDPAKPKRARALLAVTELLEDEIPEPGEGQAAYDAIGLEIAGRVHFGSPAQWAKVVRQFGDSIDLELDTEIRELGAPTPPAEG